MRGARTRALGSFSIQRVAAAKLVPERDEFSDRKGLSHLDEHHFWRANGYARSDFQERVARQGARIFGETVCAELNAVRA